MARSSYAETRSRTAVIFWSTVFFVLGILALSAVIGLVGPLINNPKGAVIPLREHLLWAGMALAVLGVLYIYNALAMGRDGHRIAKSMGGTLVDVSSGSPELYEDPDDNRKLASFVHYVETCAVAAGMSEVPQAYVLFQEQGLNAFAAGSGRGRTVVAITEGALFGFDEEELEGVVGHEIAHIVRGDTRYATRIVAFCTALMIAAELGWFLLRIRNDKRLAALGIAIALTGIAGTVMARLIQAFVSRQAEYRADASGALYAGSPTGLLKALRKIDGAAAPSEGTRIPPACSHMLLAPPGPAMSLGARVASFAFATHPPTRDRIAALEGSQGASPAPQTAGEDRSGSPFS